MSPGSILHRSNHAFSNLNELVLTNLYSLASTASLFTASFILSSLLSIPSNAVPKKLPNCSLNNWKAVDDVWTVCEVVRT